MFLNVRWSDGDGEHAAAWPVNVDRPGALPPAPELELSLWELIGVHRSSRSLPDAVAGLRAGRQASDGDVILDPLVRYADTGQLRQRTRLMSARLEGMRRFLERPAGSVDALRWRLSGPFGPRRLAAELTRAGSDGGIAGESTFVLVELALTVARVDWSAVSTPGLGPRVVRAEVREVISELGALALAEADGSPLDRYIAAAIKEASR